MKALTSFGISFKVRSDREKDGKAPLQATITVNGQKTFLTLPRKIPVKNWNPDRALAKANTSEGRKINNYIEEVRQTIGECYQDLQLQRKVISNDTSVSKSTQLDYAVPPSKISSLSSGTFVGMVADNPD
ncbi:Arm DNA-binding domain-containing protein [Mucilaginibacter lappiensis]|uniref:Arm DNA-binding domain-containing protein n=1 Tax=Mucilaginibacter lappiensis TaxID=354630 RepID=A0A841J582_9SPHI|nr:Arm DNA-binding domain-containing protein [Mucilaginibacter lappiensis]MBB6126369.1 hypothetical protein [Mucilaginibacter lappiensis]